MRQNQTKTVALVTLLTIIAAVIFLYYALYPFAGNKGGVAAIVAYKSFKSLYALKRRIGQNGNLNFLQLKDEAGSKCCEYLTSKGRGEKNCRLVLKGSVEHDFSGGFVIDFTSQSVSLNITPELNVEMGKLKNRKINFNDRFSKIPNKFMEFDPLNWGNTNPFDINIEKMKNIGPKANCLGH